jgi:hypothetical protein
LSTFIFNSGIAFSGQFETLFRYGIIKMIKAEGKINNCVIENMRNKRLKSTLEKIQLEPIHRQWIRIYLNAQFHIKKSS